MIAANLTLAVLVSAVCAALVLAGWFDVRERRIPNQLAAVVAALYPLSFPIGAAPHPWWGGLAVASGFFALGAALFALGKLGGGDVKLLAATALWVAPSQLPAFVLVVALGGALLTVPALLHGAVVTRIFGPDAVAANRTIPYGVAIAAGGAWVILARTSVMG